MTWKGETQEERKEKELAMDKSIHESVETLLARRGNVPGVGRTALGHAGYLYEAYHGGPYATLVLVPEATGTEVLVAKIPAATMPSRRDQAMATSRLRATELFGDETGALGEAMARSFADFVALAERKEAQTGKPVTIIAS